MITDTLSVFPGTVETVQVLIQWCQNTTDAGDAEEEVGRREELSVDGCERTEV